MAGTNLMCVEEEEAQDGVDAEMSLIKDFLANTNCCIKNMGYFMDGQQVAINDVLSAVQDVKSKHCENLKNFKDQVTKQHCHRVEDGTIKPTGNCKMVIQDNISEYRNPSSKPIHFQSNMNIMQEFLTEFHKKLQRSCVEFINQEFQTLISVEKKKASHDTNLKFMDNHNNNPTINTGIDSKDNNILRKIPTLQNDVINTSKDNCKYTISSNKTKMTKQVDGIDASVENSCQTLTANSTQDEKKTPVNKVVDNDYDYVSPVGMRRMFGTLYEDSKITFPPVSPQHPGFNLPINSLYAVPKLNPDSNPAVTAENELCA